MTLLDLFCGAGGAAMGYHRAGFVVMGVDINPQPNYPFAFIQADALEFCALHGREFDVIHASPPCQCYSDLQKQNKRTYPDLIPSTRAALIKTGAVYVIENVETAPLLDPIILCGTMFPGLRVIRHRKFESSLHLRSPGIHPLHPLAYTTNKRAGHYGKLHQDTSFVMVNGGGNCSVRNKRCAQGIDWDMTGREANEAIPPAYTEFIGRQIIR